jgi:hypothetical protein
MTINTGDIVRSDGRIVTQQDGRKRYIEFEAALVLVADGDEITVNPVGKQAKLICQADDLHVAKAAVQAKPVAKPAPTLKALKPAAKRRRT